MFDEITIKFKKLSKYPKECYMPYVEKLIVFNPVIVYEMSVKSG